MQEVDIVTARIIELLPPSSRERLNETLKRYHNWPNSQPHAFRAGPGELDRESIEIAAKRGKLISRIQLSPHARWERHALHLQMEMPDTMISAMRNRALDSIVAHRLFDGLIISSARRSEDVVIIETKRKPMIRVDDIKSSGIDRPIDLLETLEALGVTEVCKVAGDLIRTIPKSRLHQLAGRIAASKRSELNDLVGWKPQGVTSMRISISNNKLEAAVIFTVGRYSGGTIFLHGASRTNGRILTGPFARFRAILSNNYRSRLKQPYMTLEEFAKNLTNR